MGVRNEDEVGTLVGIWEDVFEHLFVDSQISILAEHDGALRSKSMSYLLYGGDGGVSFAGDEKGVDGLLLLRIRLHVRFVRRLWLQR